MKASKKTTSNPLAEALAALIGDLVAKEPHEHDGYIWAALHQSSYAKVLGVSDRTIRTYLRKPPFITRTAKISPSVKLCLVRLGVAAPKGANDYKRIMIELWKLKTGRTATEHEKRCLWRFAGDIL